MLQHSKICCGNDGHDLYFTAPDGGRLNSERICLLKKIIATIALTLFTFVMAGAGAPLAAFAAEKDTAGAVQTETAGSAQAAGNTQAAAAAQPALTSQVLAGASKEVLAAQTRSLVWGGTVLTRSAGRINGPSGQEVYYNLNMSRVADNLSAAGFAGEYWVRNDGVKMFGPYIMIAANYGVHPYGSLVETSLGTAIVCDTGTFAASQPGTMDIAVAW